MSTRKLGGLQFGTDDPYGDGKIKLKPCPFCGRIPKLHRFQLIKTREMAYGVWCDEYNENKCPMFAVETLPFKHKEHAIEAWNTRA